MLWIIGDCLKIENENLFLRLKTVDKNRSNKKYRYRRTNVSNPGSTNYPYIPLPLQENCHQSFDQS